jgi:hypothetical protein
MNDRDRQGPGQVGAAGHEDALRGRSELDPTGPDGAASSARGTGLRTSAEGASEGSARPGASTLDRIAESLDADVFDMSNEEVEAELRAAGADPVAVGDMGLVAAYLGKVARFGWPGEQQARELRQLLAHVRADERRRCIEAVRALDAETEGGAAALDSAIATLRQIRDVLDDGDDREGYDWGHVRRLVDDALGEDVRRSPHPRGTE